MGFLVVFVMNLFCEHASLARGLGATNKSGVAIEVLGDFLEGSVLGLNVEEENEDSLGSEPCALCEG